MNTTYSNKGIQKETLIKTLCFVSILTFIILAVNF